jgi:hypothetical protein
MKKVYKIDIKHQLKSFRTGFWILFWTSLCLPIIGFIEGFIFLDYRTLILIVFGIWLVSAVLIAIPLHAEYLSRNWNTLFSVDIDSKTVEIHENGERFVFQFSEIRTERHLLKMHNPALEHYKGGRPIAIEYYGYVRVITPNDKEFFITSLMADPFNFPLHIDSTIYRVPSIDDKISKDSRIKKTEQWSDLKVNKFVEEFDALTTEELIYKLENKSKYTKDAIEATQRILQKRNIN